jgi:nucleoside-diphosphate-sugar epimerase
MAMGPDKGCRFPGRENGGRTYITRGTYGEAGPKVSRTYLVTGATGSLGSALVRRLAGEDLRVLVRDGEAFEEAFPDLDVGVFEGDLSESEDIDRAIDDADAVFHCAGRPYFHWGDLIGHTRRLIKAAEEEVKVVDVVFPGNVHVYGDVGPGTVTEDQPHEPGTRKGTIRLNIERCLREANARGECRTAVARLPDLYGPGVTSRCQDRIFPNALKGRAVAWPGDLDAEREFVFADDAAEAMVRLSESEVAWGKAWHVPGPRATTAREFIELAFKAAGHDPVIKSTGQGSMKLSLSREAKEEAELFYLFLRPPLLDGSMWRRAFGQWPARAYEEGLAATVEWWREHPDGL